MRAGPYAVDKVIAGAPVGDDKAVKAPGIPEDFLQKMGIFIGINAVDHIVGAHDGFRMALANGNLKIGEIQFPEGPLVHDGIGGHAPQLGVVGGKMLGTGADAICLDAADIASGHFARQIGVLGEVFKIAATERIALGIHTGTEKNAYILAGSLGAQMASQFLTEFGIPAVGHGCGSGIAGGGNGAVQAQLISGTLLFADAVRTVR